MILDIMDTLNKWGDQIKVWAVEAGKNPFFWLAFIVAGCLIFRIIFTALNKDR
ncbi:MAG: hypothetical protein NC181_02960 [Clostridium sp.]|nr:hypothetical protein [Clostridium sp.]MCM1444197.1 hypothetical protein [Candidatus Amulumruptor caecigallinarius]